MADSIAVADITALQPPETADVSRPMFRIRKVADCTDPGELGNALLAELDAPQEDAERPGVYREMWQLRTVDDLDKVVAGINQGIDYADRMIAYWADVKRSRAVRREAVIAKYQFLVQAELPLGDKQSRLKHGAYSRGNYTNKPNRAPDIKLLDKPAALQAGLAAEITKTDIVPNKTAIEKYRTEHGRYPGADLGVAISIPADVNYTPPDNKKSGASATNTDQ